MASREDAQLDDIIASVTAKTNDDTAALTAFARETRASLKVPTFGLVLGERVQIDGVELPSLRRGLVGLLRKGGRSRRIFLLDVLVPGRSRGALLVRAYQRWAGASMSDGAESETAAGTTAADTIDAVILKVASETARLRPLGEDQEITLRGSGSDMWKVVPGQIVTVKPSKRWSHRRYQYMSGQIEAARIEVPALGLKPLAVRERGPTQVGNPYGADFDPLWTIVTAQSNVAYELERTVPGADERADDDPVLEALDLRNVGDNEGAEKILMDLLHADLRCLDAHALLGSWAFEMKYDSLASRALLHFEVGVRIGEQALGLEFDGRLPWTLVWNRAFLRCLHGYGRALWRQGLVSDAVRAFERVCVLDPADDIEARLCWKAATEGVSWSDSSCSR